MSKIIPVFYAADDAYAPFLAVSVNSLIKNANKDYFYNIHILSSSMSDINISRIKDLSCENAKVHFEDPSHKLSHLLSGLALRDYYSIATYYRLFIADLFPQYEKAVYIDADTAVNDDISKMFFTDIGENLVGAIEDNVMSIPVFGDYVETVLGVPREKYFNAGILLMNLKKFRETDMEGRFVKLLSKRQFPVAQDQDFLNLLCINRVHYFERKWNFPPVDGFCEDLPSIVHYKMSLRPWNYDGIKFSDIFFKYAETSGYLEDIFKLKENHSESDKEYDEQVGRGLLELALKETDETIKSGAGPACLLCEDQ